MQAQTTPAKADREREKRRALYLAVRAAFVAQGTTLARWCLQNGTSRQYAEQALQGHILSPRARALRATIIREAGLSE